MIAPSKRVNINGIETFYYDTGEGPPFIMLHGIGANSEIFHFTLKEFKQDYRCIVPDLPGNGRTGGKLQPYSIKFYVDWFDAFVTKLKVPTPFVLLAASMGAAIATAYAAKFDEKIDKLILSDALGLSGRFPWETTATLLPRIGHGLGALLGNEKEPMYRYLEDKVIRRPRGQAKEAVDNMTLVTQKSGLWPLISGGRLLLVDMLTPRKRKQFTAQLDDIKTPTLITWGRHDGILSVEHAPEAHNNMPQAQLQIFEDSAHAPMLDEPELFNERLRAFLTASGNDND